MHVRAVGLKRYGGCVHLNGLNGSHVQGGVQADNGVGIDPDIRGLELVEACRRDYDGVRTGWDRGKGIQTLVTRETAAGVTGCGRDDLDLRIWDCSAGRIGYCSDQ